jgi:ABC-type nitrate/sulfonate/bicarbonate transport system permease component
MTRHPRLLICLTLLLVLALWQAAYSFNWLGRTLLASPREVADEIVGALFIGSESDTTLPAHPEWIQFFERFGITPHHGSPLFLATRDTLLRAFVGWSLAVVFGLVIGTVLSASPSFYHVTEPLLEFIRAIPPIMIFPLLLVAFNFSDQAYVWTIVLGCLPVMVLAVARGSLAIVQERVELLSVFHVHWVVRSFARMMEVMPSLVLGARLAFSLSLIITVVMEMIFTPRHGHALGALAKDSEITFNTPTFFSCVVVLGACGYIVNLALKNLESFLRGNE